MVIDNSVIEKKGEKNEKENLYAPNKPIRLTNRREMR